MLINKITTGFVIQVFDTETQTYVSQSFTAAAEVNYENAQGETIDPTEHGMQSKDGSEPYLPFDMARPNFSAYKKALADTALDVKSEIENGVSRNDAIQTAVEEFDDDLRELLPDGSHND